MAIERAILDNIEKAAANGNKEQMKAAMKLLNTLEDLHDNGFEDYPPSDTRPSIIANGETGLELEFNGNYFKLSPRLASLYSYLLERKNKITPWEEIYKDLNTKPLNLAKNLERLRAKIEPNPNNPTIIITVHT